MKIAYSVQGSGPETVLLVMGLGGRAADWGTEFPLALAERYRVVRFDNRGVGGSPRVAGGYSLSDLARDAVAVLDAVGAEKANVIGISMGGMISQLVALEHPERVARLVLMSTHFGGHEIEPPHQDAMRMFDPQTFVEQGKDPEAMMRYTLGVISAPGFLERSPETVAFMLANVRRQPTHPGAFMAQLQAILTSDRSALLEGIRAPTVVIHGDADKLIPPSNGRALAAKIPGAKLVVFEGVGHMPMLEAPARLSEVVLSFLRG